MSKWVNEGIDYEGRKKSRELSVFLVLSVRIREYLEYKVTLFWLSYLPLSLYLL